MAGQSKGETGSKVSIDAKIAFLSESASYPFAVRAVEIRESHMSWVFLVGDRVFKMKKPVRYPFLDFGSLAARTRFVREEIRLNRRLAPDVYLGATPLTVRTDGGLALDGTGPVAEWLVEMRRLPETRMLDHVLAHGSLRAADLTRIVRRLVVFYKDLPPERISGEIYVRRFEDEHERTAAVLLDPRFAFDGARVKAVLEGFERALTAARTHLADRAIGGRIVEGHGDLRPEHVCLSRPLAIIDSLEFDRELRLVDPFDEVIFLALESARLGADWVLSDLVLGLKAGLGEAPCPAVMSVYWQYRALLRARLALLHLEEPDPRTPEKWHPQAWRYVEMAEEADLRFRFR